MRSRSKVLHETAPNADTLLRLCHFGGMESYRDVLMRRYLGATGFARGHLDLLGSGGACESAWKLWS